MKVKAGDNEIKLPEFYDIQHVYFVLKEVGAVVLKKLSFERLSELRKKEPKVAGIPSCFAVSDNKLHFFPATDDAGEIRVRYFTLHEV